VSLISSSFPLSFLLTDQIGTPPEQHPRMRASQVLSLFVELILIHTAMSLPIPKLDSIKENGEEELQLDKPTEESYRHLLPATYAQNANSHLSAAAAHLVAGTTKVVTLPAAGVVGMGRNVVNTVRGLAHLDMEKVADSGGEFIAHPVDTLAKTVAHPVAHGGLAVQSVALAVKNYYRAATAKDKKSRHTRAEVKSRHRDTWKSTVKGPVDQAMTNVYKTVRMELRTTLPFLHNVKPNKVTKHPHS
jgi:hypothetical protein